MHACGRTFILAPLLRMLLPPGPYGEPRAGGAAYLWPCGPPPWDICLLPTTCASGFPGGCSPAAGEWPGRTRRGTRSLQEQEAGAKAPLRPACLPLGPAHCPATSLPRTLLPAPWELSRSVPAPKPTAPLLGLSINSPHLQAEVLTAPQDPNIALKGVCSQGELC